jgi:D-sedoheptulose 7-phosphate isomerase
MAGSFGARLSRTAEAAAATHREFVARSATQAAEAARVIRDAVVDGRLVLVFGNGGSATDAQHLVTELVVRYVKVRRAAAAIALTADSAVLTAAANDLGTEHMFARQLEALGKRGDVAVAITTSGRSANVNAALKVANAAGMITVALTGRDGGEAGTLAQVHVNVPSDETARIQEVHRTWIHAVCEWVEEDL